MINKYTHANIFILYSNYLMHVYCYVCACSENSVRPATTVWGGGVVCPPRGNSCQTSDFVLFLADTPSSRPPDVWNVEVYV